MAAPVPIERREQDAFCCPICDYPTLGERGGYEICCLCNWEDELAHDLDETTGPNGDYTLREAQENFRRYLTMYRIGDEPRFSEARANNHMKRIFISLIDAFREEWKSGPLNFHRNARARVLWKAARFAQRQL